MGPRAKARHRQYEGAASAHLTRLQVQLPPVPLGQITAQRKAEAEPVDALTHTAVTLEYVHSPRLRDAESVVLHSNLRRIAVPQLDHDRGRSRAVHQRIAKKSRENAEQMSAIRLHHDPPALGLGSDHHHPGRLKCGSILHPAHSLTHHRTEVDRLTIVPASEADHQSV